MCLGTRPRVYAPPTESYNLHLYVRGTGAEERGHAVTLCHMPQSMQAGTLPSTCLMPVSSSMSTCCGSCLHTRVCGTCCASWLVLHTAALHSHSAAAIPRKAVRCRRSTLRCGVPCNSASLSSTCESVIMECYTVVFMGSACRSFVRIAKGRHWRGRTAS